MKVVVAADHSLQALAACFTAAFDGYIAGSFVLDAATLPRFLLRQGADLALSRCVADDAGELLGVCFVADFAGRRRIGGMGVVPKARGTGAARLLLARVIDDARAAGRDTLELEVVLENTPAVRLYRAHGFVDGAPLWGYSRAPGAPVAAEEVPKRIGMRRASRWLLGRGLPDLPYQVSGHALATPDPAPTLWRIGRAMILFVETAPKELLIAILNDLDPRQHDARRLLAAVIAAYPAHSIVVPPLMRAEVATAAFEAMGFVPSPLHQLQMRLALR